MALFSLEEDDGNDGNNILIFRINAGRKMIMKLKLSMAKSVSRRFNFLGESCIKQLQQIQLKKKTEAKCKWAFHAYSDFRNN